MKLTERIENYLNEVTKEEAKKEMDSLYKLSTAQLKELVKRSHKVVDLRGVDKHTLVSMALEDKYGKKVFTLLDEKYHEGDHVIYNGKKYEVLEKENGMLIIVSPDGKERIKVLKKVINEQYLIEKFDEGDTVIYQGKEWLIYEKQGKMIVLISKDEKTRVTVYPGEVKVKSKKKLNESLVTERTSNRCIGKVFVFTGFRDSGLEDEIEEQGGKVEKSITFDTTHVIVKKQGINTTKENKAMDKGICIWTEKELSRFLDGDKVKENRGYTPIK